MNVQHIALLYTRSGAEAMWRQRELLLQMFGARVSVMTLLAPLPKDERSLSAFAPAIVLLCDGSSEQESRSQLLAGATAISEQYGHCLWIVSAEAGAWKGYAHRIVAPERLIEHVARLIGS